MLESNRAMERRLIYRHAWVSEDGVQVLMYFAFVEGNVECVRIDIGNRMEGEKEWAIGSRFIAQGYLQPISASLIRSLGLTTRVKEARRSWARDLETIANGTWSQQVVPKAARVNARIRLEGAKEAVRRQRPGPRYRGTAHLKRVALVYREAKDRGDSPTMAVMDDQSVAYSTAARYVSLARKDGLLPPTTQGRARS